MNINVPEGAPEADARAERYRNIFNKINGARAEWIEGTIELAAFILEARIDYPDHTAFSRWLERNRLQKISKNERTALLWMAENTTVAREVLEQSKSASWEMIYKKRPNRESRALPKTRKGMNSSFSGAAGRKRKREPIIPTVMRDDYVPGARPHASEAPRSSRHRVVSVQDNPPPVRRGVNLKGLTKEQVDPDFKGTHLEFITKYGHVNLHTKEEIEYHKHQEELMAWLGLISDHAKTAHPLLTATIDPATMREWMGKPAKAEKLRVWINSIERVCERLWEITDARQSSRDETARQDCLNLPC